MDLIKRNSHIHRLLSGFIIGITLMTVSAFADRLTVWHIPSNTEPPNITMRTPLVPDTTVDPVYIFVGGYPQHSIWSGTLYHRAAGAGGWNSLSFVFFNNSGNNEYWLAPLSASSYASGTVVQYYLRLSDATDTLYVYGDDTHSNTTTDQLIAQGSPFTFTMTSPPTPTATPTGSPTPTPPPLPTINVWHIPGNEEPTGVTMRNPVNPVMYDIGYFYCGGYPQGTIWGGVLKHRAQGTTTWHTAPFYFNQNGPANEYFWALMVMNSYTPGATVQYYLAMHGNPASWATTYLYGDDTHCEKTTDEAVAQAAPYSFTLPVADTPTPTRTPSVTSIYTPTPTRTPSATSIYTPTPTPIITVSQTATPTNTVPPLPTINCWHIPSNEEPAGKHMRDPVYPLQTTTSIDFYIGGYPQHTIWTATLYYKVNTGTWNNLGFNFYAEEGSNDYWKASLTNAFNNADVISYYLKVTGDIQYVTTTYLYGTDTTSTPTHEESVAMSSPYAFVIGGATLTPTPIATATPTQPPNTPTASPTQGTKTATPVVTPTAIPTRTRTPTPLASETPSLTLGVKLEMPDHYFYTNDECWLTAYVTNPDNPISNAALAVVLDINIGMYWFWPSWVQFPNDTGDIDYMPINILHGVREVEVIPQFYWPTGTGTAEDFKFMAALLNGALTDIYGDLDIWTFGYNSP